MVSFDVAWWKNLAHREDGRAIHQKMSVQPGQPLGPRAPAALCGKGTKADAPPVLAFGPISVGLKLLA